jgi:cytochrome c oxidase assembly protein subunit 15
MPFDVHDFPGATRRDRAATRQSRRLVAVWLFVVAGMIAIMIVLGGATRLTGSGLSIMEWAPLMGTLPPMTDPEWHRLFALYQRIPQYSLVNRDYGLAEFKQIFWLEWTHRLWGRLIGGVFLVPLLWLWGTARIERRLLPRLALLFALGGLQGAVGWFMVTSGFLPDSTAVSPYRLVIHLALALLLYAVVVWTGLAVLRPARLAKPQLAQAQADHPAFRGLAVVCVISVSVTILAGGFVAGLHAGLTYNSFPLMDGHVVPVDYAVLHPFLRNLTENIAAVQFDHRVLATVTLCLVSAMAVMAPIAGLPGSVALCILAAVLVQYCLGVATLLLVVPVALAAAHQFGAIVLLTAVLIVLHHLTGRRKSTIYTASGPNSNAPLTKETGGKDL